MFDVMLSPSVMEQQRWKLREHWMTKFWCWTFAIEWNKDIHYFSNIIESLSRDLHCYCIQVNSSDYGDSRIVKPARTEEKDIIQTKGGENSTVLIGEIDIKLLRDFQMKQGALQAQDKSFKTTPPDFDRMFVKKRQNGTL